MYFDQIVPNAFAGTTETQLYRVEGQHQWQPQCRLGVITNLRWSLTVALEEGAMGSSEHLAPRSIRKNQEFFSDFDKYPYQVGIH